MKQPDDSHVSDRLGDHLEGDLSLAEFARVDAHLARCRACADELRELRATVALLRGLPDPEPRIDLAASVMRRIDAGEGRPSRVTPIFRRVTEPRFMLVAMAAGVAGLTLFISSEFGTGDVLGIPAELSPDRIVVADGAGGTVGVGTVEARRPPSLSPASRWRSRSPSARAANPLIAFTETAPPLPRTGPPEGFGFFGNAAPEGPLRNLDAELEALYADPAAFLDRLRRTSEESRRPLIAPLIEHSVRRRGDATEIARAMGTSARPMAVPVSATVPSR